MASNAYGGKPLNLKTDKNNRPVSSNMNRNMRRTSKLTRNYSNTRCSFTTNELMSNSVLKISSMKPTKSIIDGSNPYGSSVTKDQEILKSENNSWNNKNQKHKMSMAEKQSLHLQSIFSTKDFHKNR